jgi:Fe-S cluster biogenesis protein NfuA
MPGPRAPAAGERYRDVRQGWLRVRLEGGCQGCSLAEVTLRQGIEPLLRARVPEMVGLIDVTDHEAGTPLLRTSEAMSGVAPCPRRGGMP